MKKVARQNIHDLVSPYALGILDDGDRAAFEKHLAAGCAPCQDGLRRDRESLAGLSAAAATGPPANLRQRLLGRARQAPRFPGVLYQQEGLLISSSAEMDWKPLAPGVSYKPLFRDQRRKYLTSVVRMDPGASYPGHRHVDVEELFMISGDFHVAGMAMGPGDYCRAEPHTLHGMTYSESGCVFLLCASERNEVIA